MFFEDYALCILGGAVLLCFYGKRYVAAIAALVAVIVAGGVLVVTLSHGQANNTLFLPKQYTYQIVKTYPHDNAAFTEGLVFTDGVLYESTGGYGSSSLRRVNLETGLVEQEILLPTQYFGEGLTIVNDSLVQLTWQNNIGFTYNKETFGLFGNFSYSTEGWGLTYNGSELIMSDGSSNLTFLDPVTYQKVGQVSVHDGNATVTNINELEFINGDVYANIWLQQKIVIINLQTGSVKGWIDLTGIYQSNNPDDVLNGIAHDAQSNSLFVTGKDWPNLYQIAIIPTNSS